MSRRSRRAARMHRAQAAAAPRADHYFAQSPENPSTSLSNPDAWLLDWSNGGVPLFGPPVSEQTAMAVSAVYRCVAILSGLIASTPLKVYRDDPDLGRVEAPDHLLADLFALQPYPGRSLTSYSWRELWAANVLLWGNHVSAIRRNRAGRIMGFEACWPWATEIYRYTGGPRKGENFYVVQWPDGTRETLFAEDVIHLAGPGFDGIKGASRIQSAARNSISLARLLEEQTGRVHENAARPSGMIGLPPGISPDGKRRLEAYLSDRYTGRLNAGKVMFVDKDTTYTPMQLTPEDLATLEARRFQIADISRFFGVPLHLLNEAGDTTNWGSGLEQIMQAFKILTLAPEFARIEAELNAKLITPGTGYYCRFDREALDAMDGTVQSQMLTAQINAGVVTINEARRKLNRPVVANGDEVLVNSTLMPLSRAINPPPPPPPPAPNPPPKEKPSRKTPPQEPEKKDANDA